MKEEEKKQLKETTIKLLTTSKLYTKRQAGENDLYQ